MMTREEERREFWMLTKGILEDSTVETDEAQTILRWLEEHHRGTEFDSFIKLLRENLSDGWIDRFESKTLVDVIGRVLQILRAEAQKGS